MSDFWYGFLAGFICASALIVIGVCWITKDWPTWKH